MKSQTVVRHKATGRKGVVVTDPFGACDETEVPVIFEGDDGFVGIPADDLEDLGPENAQADLEKCGAGRGAECCIFLAVGANGSECARFGALRWSIIFRKEKMNARREPKEPYPQCQLS